MAQPPPLSGTTPSAEARPPAPTLYLGYGSNLSSTQMAARCPGSPAVALGRLPGWRWLIMERGYANVAPDAGGSEWGAYGVVYALTPADEAALDGYEGVPESYEKVWLDVEVVEGADGVLALFREAAAAAAGPAGAAAAGKEEEEGEGEGKKKVVKTMLVYVDYKRVRDSKPKEEYIFRMNRGIKEATEEWNLPKDYVDEVMRPFIPAPPEDDD